MKSRRFEVDPWEMTFHLLWELREPQQVVDYVYRAAGVALEDPGKFSGISYANSKHVFVGLLGRWRGTLKDQGVLVHELAHATFFILRERDVTHNARTDEVFAYTLESLYKRCRKILDKRPATR